MNMRLWSQRRRTWWRRGWIALIAGVLLCPIGTVSTCYDAAPGHGDSYCQNYGVPLPGVILPMRYPLP